jgi:hypothetical protein
MSLSLVLVVSLMATPGCSVWETVSGIGDGYVKKTEEPEAAKAAAPGNTPQAKLKAYYNREPKKVEKDPNNPIVTCTVRGSTSFLRRDDCQLRGGSEKA